MIEPKENTAESLYERPVIPIPPKDVDRVRSALRKINAREPLFREERRAVLRYFEAEREAWWEFCIARTTAKQYRAISGRDARVLIDQAERYGIPVTGRTVSLAPIVKWIHDFFRQHSRGLGVMLTAAGDPVLSGQHTDAREDYIRESARIKRLDRLEREGKLWPSEFFVELLKLWGTALGKTRDRVAKHHGAAAAAIVDEGRLEMGKIASRLKVEKVEVH